MGHKRGRNDSGARDQWAAYLRRYHEMRPGITEAAFEHARDPSVGTPYDWLVQALPHRPGHVLDIACGNAPLQPRLATADSYVGVDLSAAELTRARTRGRGPVVRADARRLPLPDRSVDAVVSSMGLMLLTPLTDALHEVARVLKPGGVLAALVPAKSPISINDIRPLLTLAVSLRGTASMLQHLTRRRLSRELTRAGLVLIDAQRHRFRFPLHSRDDASLAVRALYTRSRQEGRLDVAINALTQLSGSVELPLPLLRIVARRPLH